MVDNLSRGPTLVSGGSPTVGSGSYFNGFLMVAYYHYYYYYYYYHYYYYH